MAGSNAHRWGQIIGNVFQSSVRSLLEEVAQRHGLFLDTQGPRPARRGLKVRWRDQFGNAHDLDYVLERGGSDATQGVPAAFIETAWRRYSKHAKNKAQEIEGALAPLQQTYRHLHPFLGATLAGDFTQSSLDQLRSRGFFVLHFPLRPIFDAFALFGVDAASTEQTSEDEFADKINMWFRLRDEQRGLVERQLLMTQTDSVARFRDALDRSLSRAVNDVAVTVWRGQVHRVGSIVEAVLFLLSDLSSEDRAHLTTRYEVEVRYSNGDTINATFQQQEDAISFLRSFE